MRYAQQDTPAGSTLTQSGVAPLITSKNLILSLLLLKARDRLTGLLASTSFLEFSELRRK